MVFRLLERDLTIDDVINYGRNLKERLYLDRNVSKENSDVGREFMEKLLSDFKDTVRIYGVTHAYGHRVGEGISAEQRLRLPENLINSMIIGIGDYLPKEWSRGFDIARISAVAKKYSGIKTSTIQAWIDMSNAGIITRIPELGSVGASGDLIPSAYPVGALMGLEQVSVKYKGKTMPAPEALQRAGLKPVVLSDKEAIGLINGVTLSAVGGAFAMNDTFNLMLISDLLTAFHNQVLLGSTEPYWPEIHELKGHPGQIESARNILNFSKGSKLLHHVVRTVDELEKGVKEDNRYLLQPFYEQRCAPQLTGAGLDFLKLAMDVLSREINAVSDNPLVFPDKGKYAQGGNFFGMHVTYAMDTCSEAIYNVCNLIDMQFHGLLDTSHNYGLSSGLILPGSSATMGFQTAQLLVTSIVSFLDTVSYPTLSRWTDGHNQKITSMCLRAALGAEKNADLAYGAAATFLLALCQAADLRGGGKNLSHAAGLAYDAVRDNVPKLENDRPMQHDVEYARDNVLRNQGLLKELKTIAAS